ncbi:Uncharacterized protein SCF082_LOCUS18671 [Durusdinium trenchii]|uniref:Beta-galactosidase n=1 Tax=Durusdinium trenchii TaxID=1381693 RepID=A0ABP0KTB7_9DINO
MDCAKGMVYSQISSFDEVSANGHVEVMEAYPWAFQVHVLGRVLETAKKVPCERDAHVVNFWPMQRHAEVQAQVPSAALQNLEDGPYFIVASFLDANSLAAADAACQAFRTLNMIAGGPWQSLGEEMFQGLELEEEGTFQGDGTADPARVARVDWRGRFARFRRALPSFRPPFAGPEISSVEQADEIAYCRCRLRADVLSRRLDVGIYLEVEVFTNPDNVSLAVVDFEAGGCSSVTFSPDTGAVIRERKVREAPRKVEGAYIQPLATITAGQGFEGCMGVYLGAGNLAFFRRHYRRNAENQASPGPWETTGFVTDLSWAEGSRLTPCLAFRNEGLVRNEEEGDHFVTGA